MAREPHLFALPRAQKLCKSRWLILCIIHRKSGLHHLPIESVRAIMPQFDNASPKSLAPSAAPAAESDHSDQSSQKSAEKIPEPTSKVGELRGGEHQKSGDQPKYKETHNQKEEKVSKAPKVVARLLWKRYSSSLKVLRGQKWMPVHVQRLWAKVLAPTTVQRKAKVEARARGTLKQKPQKSHLSFGERRLLRKVLLHQNKVSSTDAEKLPMQPQSQRNHGAASERTTKVQSEKRLQRKGAKLKPNPRQNRTP